jgi:hypothetical protein
MFTLFVVALAVAAPAGGAMSPSPSAFVSCLREAAASARPPAVPVDGFVAFAKGRCTGQEETLKSALIAFDMKNGSSRKSAAEGAQFAVDDYLETARGNYAASHSN